MTISQVRRWAQWVEVAGEAMAVRLADKTSQNRHSGRVSAGPIRADAQVNERSERTIWLSSPVTAAPSGSEEAA